jgi:Chemotaxis response regulator containing a CheY-like receiver domain and a methylesterase domain
MHTRDIVVVGSSMGGVEALSSLARQLPEDLPAAVLVVQHTSPESPGLLGEILSRQGPLPAVIAEDGMEIERGRIYVAPPNRHLLATADGIRVNFGPRENRSRPAIDPLFRTAAVNYRSRVIGIVLTGLLGDGAAGLLAVHRCGGMALVQAPDDAAFADMPRRALDVVKNAQKFVMGDLGRLLVRHCGEPAPEPPPVPEALLVETKLTEQTMVTEDWGAVPGRPTSFTCPECRGAIHEIREEGLTRFRCRVGHAYSTFDLLGDKAKAVEESLWVALQTLDERAQMLEIMAGDDRQRGWHRTADDYVDRARETRAHADRLRDLLVTTPV